MNFAALPWWLDALLAFLVLAGAGFALVGAWALARWKDFFHRLHGPSKATTLGVGAMLIAAAIYFAWQGSWTWQELLIAAFLSLTAPVSAHLLVQAAAREARAQGAQGDAPGRPGEPGKPGEPGTRR